ncbi:MAG: spore germination protein [Bacillaceae bacterium]|nr:spore germination protein [Bacillaceae bacterium]
MGLFSFLKKVRRSQKNVEPKSSNVLLEKKPIEKSLYKNVQYIKSTLGNAPDLVIREVIIRETKLKGAILFIDGIVDENLLNEFFLTPLLQTDEEIETLDQLEQTALQLLPISRLKDLNVLIKELLSGNSIFLLEGQTEAIKLAISAWEMRSIDEPETEATVRGPREGFNESLGVSLTLIRRKIVNPNLRFEVITVGAATNTKVCLVYIHDLASPRLVKEIKKRINKIEHDTILESGYIEQFIEDDSSSIFPTIGNTEKPDKLAAKILEGRIGILVDGTPIALSVPYLFVEAFQTAEDYYSRQYYSSLVRIIRFLSFGISINFPALYVATQNFHKEMIPTELLASIAAAREGVPFPLVMELVMMLIVFEILREAGVRMPQAIGQAMSIVGALILGDAAVQAGVVGTPTIIIIGITGITSFVVTPLSDSSAILRFLFIVPASVIGLYGLILANLVLLVHLSSIKSAGIPYLSPISPAVFNDWRDVFVRLHPKFYKETRAKSIPLQKDPKKYRFEPEDEQL